ncbi:bacteriohemerythrin [Colwellia sp. RSH04]|uniref:bacteriohemerythrin n=1 Tax=Colwellia sp. RSH04 TaxID=2305464 RepID=UPI000E5949F6|nr:bacteriohemerythrin [Colwellia sp. RSH04]RHW77781.1 EAL domain-containing protein [Colwellia sp. RSH04]
MSIDHNNQEFFEIFPWNENFSTGIDSIDDQHKQLVRILNRLAANLANLSAPIILNEIFDELAEYADYHFKSEELIWVDNFKNDEWVTQHSLTHGSFIDKVIEIKNNKDNKSLDDVIYDIITFLSNWLAYHILDTDKRMALAVIALKSGNTLEEAKAISAEGMSGSMETVIRTVLTMYSGISARTLDLMREKSRRKQAEAALHISEERWKFILDAEKENVWDLNLENKTKSLTENDSSIIDIVQNKIQGNDKSAQIHPDDIDLFKKDFLLHLQGKTKFFTNKHRELKSNGSWSWVLSRGKVVSRNESGQPLRMVGTHSDITERELASIIFNHSSQAMMVTDENNNIISINKAFTKITGYKEDEILGKPPSILSSGIHDKQFYKMMWEEINRCGSWSSEVYNKRKNGQMFCEFLSINTVKNQEDGIDYFVALFSDITQQKKADETIQRQASFDSLTNLPNKVTFQNRLEEQILWSKRSKLPFAVLFVDLDHFKDVNDSLGHESGDQLLIQASNRLKDCVRESDIVARFGGDEFTILLPDIKDTEIIERVAKNIILRLIEPFDVGINRVYVSASIGITLYPNDADTSLGLLRNADQAMYKAKQTGRSRFNYFTPAMQERAQERQRLVTDLHNAIELKQFELYYQPIFDMKTKKLIKAEALIRWNHPIKGLVSPDEFIPLSEKSGLINKIGDWVFKEATTQTKKWQNKYQMDLQISINKSPIQFKSESKVKHWLEFIKEIGLSSESIIIEITENVLMDNENDILDRLLKFREAGFMLALDDFGTGYSSLSYLRKFPIDYMKIDRSFVSNLSNDAQDMVLCEAMIGLAQKLGIKVIAEGIETPLQSKLISDMDCDYGQGYLFSKPIPASEFDALLKDQCKPT